MRLFVPGWEGNLNIKWLHRLEVTDVPAYTKDESALYTQILKDDRIERYAAHSFNHYNAIQPWRVNKDGRIKNTYV